MSISFKKVIGFTSIGLLSSFLLMLSSFIFIRGSSPEISGTFFFYVTISSFIANIALFGNATYFNKSIPDTTQNNLSDLTGNLRYFFVFAIFIAAVYVVILLKSDYFFIFAVIFIEIGILKVYRERLYSSYARYYRPNSSYFWVQGQYVLGRLIVVSLYYFNLIEFNALIFLILMVSLISTFGTLDFFHSVFESKKSGCRSYFGNGNPLFIATIFTMGFDYAPIFVLGFLGGDLDGVGLFSSSYKIISILVLSLGVLTQSLLPYFRGIFNEHGRRRAILYGFKVIFLLLILYIPVSYGLYRYADIIITTALGDGYASATAVLKYQSIGVWGSIINFVSFATLHSINEHSIVVMIIAPCAILNVLLCLYLAPYGAQGVSIAMSVSLVACSLLALLRLYYKYRSS